MAVVKRSVGFAAVLLGLNLTSACGSEPAKEEVEDTTSSQVLVPLAEGNTWTYRITEGDKVTMKVVTVGAPEKVGGVGPNRDAMAFKTRSEREGEVTFSWQAKVDGKLVRYREQTTETKSGDVTVEEHWEPYRVYVDETDVHLIEGASWLEEFEEIVTKDGASQDPDTIRERWTVLKERDKVTVPAGTFDAVVLQKAGRTKLKTYWYVPGIGKVKESGGQVEELSDYQVED